MLWRGRPPPFALLLLAGVAVARRARAPAAAPRPPSDEAVRALLKRRTTAGASRALVVGTIDPDGKRRVIAEAAPGLPAVGGATALEMGSITKVFTAALLADMVERGEVRSSRTDHVRERRLRAGDGAGPGSGRSGDPRDGAVAVAAPLPAESGAAVTRRWMASNLHGAGPCSPPARTLLA